MSLTAPSRLPHGSASFIALGSSHFLTRSIQHVATAMSLRVLALNFERIHRIPGFEQTRKAMPLLDA